MKLNDWKPAPRTGTLVIRHVHVIDDQGEKKHADAPPGGDMGLVLRLVAWLSRDDLKTTLAALKDLYEEVTPPPEQPRHPGTGAILTNKDGSPRTADRRRDMARTYVTRLAGSGWLEHLKNGTVRPLKATPDDWRRKDPRTGLRPQPEPAPYETPAVAAVAAAAGGKKKKSY